MMRPPFCLAWTLIFLLSTGCGYRFVDPFPASGYALGSVQNSTSEPALASLLEFELRKAGGFKAGSPSRLSVTVTGFEEAADSVSSDGTPVRQRLKVDVAWKVEREGTSGAALGTETAVRSYAYSSDTVTLERSRSSAVRLLLERSARQILESLGRIP